MDIYGFCYEIQYISSPICLIDMTLTEYTKGDMKNIHTKFEVDQRKFNFSLNYDILVNFSYSYLLLS